ncbi:Sulfate permease [Globisporangium polare]
MSRRSGFNDSFNVHVDDLEAGNSNGSGAFASNRSDLDRWYFRALSNDSLVVTGAGHVTRTSSFSSEGEYENASFTSAVLYDVINSILTIPFTYGYATIIFSHPDFATFMPSLSKLVMLSNVVHQVMFTMLSSLPFAIGQTQNAGLTSLSAMAASISNSLGPEVSLEAKITTVVVTIGIATAALGVCLVLIGRFKLANLASYVPMRSLEGTWRTSGSSASTLDSRYPRASSSPTWRR